MGDHPVWAILSGLSAVGIIAGFYLDWRAWSRHRSEEGPRRIPSWNPKHWRPPTRSWYRDEQGYRLTVFGRWLIVLSAALGAVTFIMLGWVL